MKIYIDSNYPRPVVKILAAVHNLQKKKEYEIINWQNEDINDDEIKNSVFLVVDFQKKGISIPIVKQSKEGYKTVVCRVMEEKIDRFEFAMTVLRVWPQIIEKFTSESNLFSFKYGGKKLTAFKIKENNLNDKFCGTYSQSEIFKYKNIL